MFYGLLLHGHNIESHEKRVESSVAKKVTSVESRSNLMKRELKARTWQRHKVYLVRESHEKRVERR